MLKYSLHRSYVVEKQTFQTCFAVLLKITFTAQKAETKYESGKSILTTILGKLIYYLVINI